MTSFANAFEGCHVRRIIFKAVEIFGGIAADAGCLVAFSVPSTLATAFSITVESSGRTCFADAIRNTAVIAIGCVAAGATGSPTGAAIFKIVCAFTCPIVTYCIRAATIRRRAASRWACGSRKFAAIGIVAFAIASGATIFVCRVAFAFALSRVADSIFAGIACRGTCDRTCRSSGFAAIRIIALAIPVAILEPIFAPAGASGVTFLIRFGAIARAGLRFQCFTASRAFSLVLVAITILVLVITKACPCSGVAARVGATCFSFTGIGYAACCGSLTTIGIRAFVAGFVAIIEAGFAFAFFVFRAFGIGFALATGGFIAIQRDVFIVVFVAGFTFAFFAILVVQTFANILEGAGAFRPKKLAAIGAFMIAILPSIIANTARSTAKAVDIHPSIVPRWRYSVISPNGGGSAIVSRAGYGLVCRARTSGSTT